MSIILEHDFSLKKGNHLYVYHPSGFYPDEYNETRPSPVLSVDGRVISVDEYLARVHDGCAYLICGCNDYKRREKEFESGQHFTRGWDCVATCEHIALLRRYFARPLMEKVLEEILKTTPNPLRASIIFFESREINLFFKAGLEIIGQYLGEKEREATAKKI